MMTAHYLYLIIISHNRVKTTNNFGGKLSKERGYTFLFSSNVELSHFEKRFHQITATRPSSGSGYSENYYFDEVAQLFLLLLSPIFSNSSANFLASRFFSCNLEQIPSFARKNSSFM